MAFRDSNPSGALVKGSQEGLPQAQLVGENEPIEVVLENLGFLGLNGDTKVKLFAQGYDTDSLPIPSASLFAIANKRGLFAAAAFSNLIVGSTSSLREAFTNTSEKIASYNSRTSLSLPANISHVAFTADESHLVLGSSSGGLAVYLVNDFPSAGSDLKPVFELGTDGVSLRELKPNPAVPELVAIVTTAGEVQIINIDRRGFEKSSSGDVVLKKEASTVSWSQKGKQLVCGMGDGTGWQMTPGGEVKAVLPSVPGLENHFISSIVWVENNSFITTHTPVPSGDTNNESVFHALARDRDGTYQYMKLPDPVPPFGMESRAPPYFFHSMIRQYAPGIKDTVIFANTCSSDVGLVCRFSTALAGDPAVPADRWITANIGDDARRAQMPLSDESIDTSPVGMALDLSNKTNVKRPVGGEEIEESPGPLPILMVLNHEGLLSAWNVIYNDAIERGERYSGMMVYVAQGGSLQSAPQTPQQPASQRQPIQNVTSGPPFGVSSFGQSPVSSGNGTFGQSPSLGSPNTFGKPATGAFGQPAASPAFGQPSSINTSGASAFGKPPALGGSLWGSTSGASPSTTIPTSGAAFGQPSALGARPAFGQPATLGGQPAFGRTAAFGVQPTFGQPAPLGSATTALVFGAPTLLGANKPGAAGFGAVSSLGNPSTGGSPFGSGSALGSGSAFGAYANKGGFSAAAAAGSGDSKPIWGTGKSLGSDSTPTAFGGSNNVPSPFGSGGTDSFKMSSAFKPEPLSTSESKPSSSSGSFGGFGMRLGDALTSSSSLVSRPELSSSLPTPSGVSDQNIRDASMDDSDEQPDEPSDDGDIISPGVIEARQAGFTSTPAKPGLPSGIFSNTKAAADSSPFTSGSFASVNQSSSPFSSVSSPSSKLPSSTWEAQLKTPFGAPSTPPPKSPFATIPRLSSPFSGRPLAFAQSPEKRPELTQSATTAPVTSSPPPPPLPPYPSLAPVEKGLESLPALPADGSPRPALSKEIPSIPLPPDPKSVQESSDARAGELPSLPSSAPESLGTDNEKVISLDGSDDDNDGYQESKGEDDEEDERDNEGGDEDEDGDDEDEDNSERNDSLPSGGLAHEPKSKLPSTSSSPSTSNIFRAGTSYKETFGGGIEENAPFSVFARSRPPVDDSDSDRSSNSLPTGSGLRSRSISEPVGPPSTKNKEKRNSVLSRGGMFNRPPKKPDTSKVLNAPPPPDFLASGSKPQGTSPFRLSAALTPDNLLHSINKPTGSSPLAAPALQVKQASQEEREEEVQEEEEVESDLDFDNEYDDYDPDRVRNKLLNSDVKPVQELPKFRRNGEVEVASDFNAVFDSIYLSGNMMINRLGLTAQGLKAYHLGQESPLPDVEHKAAKDMKHSQDWRFCEMGQVKEILGQLLTSVRDENQGNDELEVKYQAASKGYIKLDIKDAEIKRLLAVHSDAQAAAIVRARPLTPEQVLQQRKLRKEYAKVERLLKEAEKEVTQLKAKIASRDRDRPGAVVPPTVEAVKNTIMKLTGMVERKNGDIDYLEERLRRIKIKSRSVSTTPSKPRGLTPNQTLRGETPQRFETPEKLRSYDHNISSISYSASPVLVLADPLDVEEAREEIRARKEMGRKLRDALERCGPKLTTVSK